jgi:hypothetical protein
MINVTQADVTCHQRRQYLVIIYLIKFPLHVHKRLSESNVFQRYLPTVRVRKEVPWMVTKIMLEDYRILHEDFMTLMAHVNQP